MQEKFYQNSLYPLQDKVLHLIQDSGVDFYLTGGTALSRCYLCHRYSDDLDFFVNGHSKFRLQCQLVVDALKKSDLHLVIGTAADTFLRVFIDANDFNLKVDFVNDVAFHWGAPQQDSIFHRVDNWRNILSNKLCALSRNETKDIVDIIFIAKYYAFDWEDIIQDAKQKDLWVDPIEICKLIHQFPVKLLNDIKWTREVDFKNLNDDLTRIHKDIFYGNSNSLKVK